jgi:hypothetical protein
MRASIVTGSCRARHGAAESESDELEAAIEREDEDAIRFKLRGLDHMNDFIHAISKEPLSFAAGRHSGSGRPALVI